MVKFRKLIFGRLIKIIRINFFNGGLADGGLRLGLWSCGLRLRVNGRERYKNGE